MMQGAESDLFTLEYHRLEWFFNRDTNMRLENYLSILFDLLFRQQSIQAFGYDYSDGEF